MIPLGTINLLFSRCILEMPAEHSVLYLHLLGTLRLVKGTLLLKAFFYRVQVLLVKLAFFDLLNGFLCDKS